MLIQATLVAIVAFLASVDEQLFGASMMGRPLFTGMLVGAIMGDVATGVTVGAALEAMFMGSIMVGSAVPPEVYASSTLSIAIAINAGTGAGSAVALALPPVCVPSNVAQLLLCSSGQLGWSADSGRN